MVGVGVFFVVVPFGGIALLASWRGRDRAAAGLALWAIASVVGIAASSLPLDGRLGLSVQLGVGVLYLLARVGFYMMVESMAGTALTPRSRALWRGSFLLLLGAGAAAKLGGVLVFVAYGWAEFLRPQYGFVFTVSYFVPVVLLFANYRRADGAQRLRLRWMLWSSVVLVTSIFLNNTPLLGFWASQITNTLLLPIAMAGFLYAVLRHRVVDVSVVLNRALVYAATTSLVLGLFALLESLIERTTLGHGAGLLLELAVPLGLGAALSTVHRRIEAIVERFFFRHQYRAETALRRFAEECAFITQPENLFDLTVEQIARHAGAPRVALYERTPEAYIRIRQHGAPALPEQVATDDLAFVKLRARNAELDLDDTRSRLGADGYAFPLMLRGTLLGALVVGQRPGEHYAADERELLFHVAHEVGAALFALPTPKSKQPGSWKRIAGKLLWNRVAQPKSPRRRPCSGCGQGLLGDVFAAPWRRAGYRRCHGFLCRAGRHARCRALPRRVRASRQSPGQSSGLWHTHHKRPTSLSAASLSVLGCVPKPRNRRSNHCPDSR